MIAGAIECEFCVLRVGRGLISNRLEAGGALFRAAVSQLSCAGFDGIIETAEPLVCLGASSMKFRKMFAAALGALLTKRFGLSASRWGKEFCA